MTRFIWLKNQANALSKNAKKEVNAIKLANIAPTFPTVFKAPVDILSNILVYFVDFVVEHSNTEVLTTDLLTLWYLIILYS